MIEQTIIKINRVENGVVFYTIRVYRENGHTDISGSTPIGTEINITDLENDDEAV